MDLDEIRQLMRDFEQMTVRELEIDNGDFHLRLSKNKSSQISSPIESENHPTDPALVAKAETQTVTAPLVGVVYLRPQPDQPPYVQVGDQVEEGTTVCVIEAMKMVTEIKSQHAGQVAAIAVQDGELVEFGQPLMEVAESR